MSPEERHNWGQEGREWTQKAFNFDTFVETWDTLFTNIHDKYGSWNTRTGYDTYHVEEI
jgi:hypothetical protein